MNKCAFLGGSLYGYSLNNEEVHEKNNCFRKEIVNVAGNKVLLWN